MHDFIEVIGAYEHNLKNISVKIPKNKLVAITGPSGSGKSTFAMDILQRECQRQYLESMGLVTDGLNKPKVEKIVGLSPAIGISQRGLSGSKRSNVGTYTEILTYLRVLYAKLGVRECPMCQSKISADLSSMDSFDNEGDTVSCQACGHNLPKLTMGMFSFNKVEGTCKTCEGDGTVTDIDLRKVVNESLTLEEGAVSIWGSDPFGKYYGEVLERCGNHYGFEFDASKTIEAFTDLERLVFYDGVDSKDFIALFPGVKKPKKVHDGYFKGIHTFMREKARENAHKAKKNTKITQSFVTKSCETCNGSRLGHEGRTTEVKGKTIVELSQLDLQSLHHWLDKIELSDRENRVLFAVLSDLKKRVKNVISIGLSYLSLDRPTSTLSGGEAQRLKLSNIIDSGLTGVLYILDEPTTGLHPHDGKMLLKALRKVRDLGNTVLVIEHDTGFIRNCDHVIDFGPHAGPGGGEVVFSGPPKAMMNDMASLTAKFLREKVRTDYKETRFTKMITVKNAYANNLKNVTVDVPLDAVVTFTGLSGSGKSSLLMDVIYQYATTKVAKCDAIHGLDTVDRIVAIDQGSIGRMIRSNVATYTDIYTIIRDLFAKQKEAKAMKLKPSYFSFNVKGGRCERCQGLGVVKLDMHFLDDVEVECPVCHGQRFSKEVLRINYRGKNISDVLNMTVDECTEHFSDVKQVIGTLNVLQEVGLGYLRLGQTTITLSGGECQRIKLAKELSKEGSGKCIYILDEPTTGLHPSDTEKLITLLHTLKSKGHSIFVIEHALEVIAASDYIIDLGPKGGVEGGNIIAAARAKDFVTINTGYTQEYLSEYIGGM